MTAVTLSTVGYTDMFNVANNFWASWYTMLLIISGMGIVLYSISFLASLLVDGGLRDIFYRHTLDRRIRKMNRHYIICGAGETGLHVIREMHSSGKQLVVIDNKPEALEVLKEELPECATILGDATRDHTLKEAHIERAEALVAVLHNDKDNIFLTLSARSINPDLVIITKVAEEIVLPRMYSAGATHVISPNLVGGRRIASELLRPRVVNFLEQISRASDPDLHFEEVIVSEDSPLSGSSLAESHIQEKTNLIIIAYSRDGKNFIYNPPSHLILRPGTTLIFIGATKQQRKLQKLLMPNPK